PFPVAASNLPGFALDGVLVDGNKAPGGEGGRGGGIANQGKMTIGDTQPSANSNVTDNMATVTGGGVYGGGGTLTIDNTTIGDNVSALGDGGGLNSIANLTLTHSALTGNLTPGHGGGLKSQGGEYAATLQNDTVSGN